MVGEKDLDILLGTMSAKLVDGVFGFVTLEDRQIPSGVNPRMIFQESEGTTLILKKSDAEQYDLEYEFASRMITLNIHSSLEAVGFMARIATELAKADMGVNPVAGFFHDHIFVPDGREQDALKILARIASDNSTA